MERVKIVALTRNETVWAVLQTGSGAEYLLQTETKHRTELHTVSKQARGLQTERNTHRIAYRFEASSWIAYRFEASSCLTDRLMQVRNCILNLLKSGENVKSSFCFQINTPHPRTDDLKCAPGAYTVQLPSEPIIFENGSL